MIPAVMPVAMMIIGAALLLAAGRVLIRQRRIVEVVPYQNVNVELPMKWNDQDITQLLQRYHNQPAVLAHVVGSIKTRMILNQNLKTAQRRLQLLASVIEVFKLNRELQGILQDLHLAEKDFEIRQIETEIRLEDAQARQKSERKLRTLREQRDELQLQKETSQLKQDIHGIEQPQGIEPKLSPEQQRRLKRMEIEDKLAELDRLEGEACARARDDEERLRTQNMYADRREELREQLARNLV
jgi:hypothetical protein